MPNRDETESWEDSIDKGNGKDLKFKYPITFGDSLNSIDFMNMPKMEIKIPNNLKKTITKIIDTSKRNKKNKGLF